MGLLTFDDCFFLNERNKYQFIINMNSQTFFNKMWWIPCIVILGYLSVFCISVETRLNLLNHTPIHKDRQPVLLLKIDSLESFIWIYKQSKNIFLLNDVVLLVALLTYDNYGKKKTEQLLREQKSMKMLTNLHKIYSEW